MYFLIDNTIFHISGEIFSREKVKAVHFTCPIR